MGEKKGIEEGEQLGKSKTIRDTTINLLRLGAAISVICQSLDVSEVYVLELKKKKAYKMAKSNLKTTQNDNNVQAFLEGVAHEKRREDSLVVLDMMKNITDQEPKMWGSSIVGFDHYHYKYDSGREGDFFKVGFSPRKQSLTIYVMPGFTRYEELMEQLGKYKTGKSCLYINKLEDVDLDVLRQLIKESYEYMTEKYG